MPLVPKTNINKSQFIKLGWDILYYKCLYYELSGNKRFDYLRISDDKFDELTKQYLKIAKTLNLKPTAHEQVGFSPDSPSGSLVLAKILMTEYYDKKHKRNVSTK